MQKDEIKAFKGKNIIVLSLESMEKGYLGEKLKHLTPNLSELAKDHTLFNMKQSPAGGWASASMYTVITGVPAFFGTHGNSVFQNSYENKLTSLTDVLENAGYDLQYFIGKKEYSGIDDMLKTFGFTVKSEKDFEEQYEKVDWGIQDKDLFHEFKKELLLKKDSGNPFALFLSTISTHFPNGVPDKRMDSLLPPQKSRLELMASATDYLIGDLMEFLENEQMLSNTVFFIYPDHLLMGNKSRVLEDFDERSLYLLTNADINKIDYPVSEEIYQIDIPKIILEGAEIKHNVKFLTDFIKDKNKNTFLRKNDKNLLRLNDAALKTLNCKEGIFVVLNEEKGEFEIKNSEDLIMLSNKLPNKGACQRILFDKNLRPYKDFEIDVSQLSSKTTAATYLDVFVTNGSLHASLKGKHRFGITKKGEGKITFNKEDLALLDNIRLNENKLNHITLNSNSWNAKKPSGFTIKGQKVNISRGLTVIGFNDSSPQYESKTFDTYASVEDAEAFVKTLEIFNKNKIQYIVLGHDSAAKNLQSSSEKLKEAGFIKLSGLMGRQAYIAHNLNGEVFENIDDTAIKLEMPFPKSIKNTTTYFSQPKFEFKPHVDRYIAHAGGTIDGLKYTNSKEALDYSYAQGFRLFELDIIETADGDYVAAHDWKHWAKETNFKGDVPTTGVEFLKHKIRGKYSTLDMDGINNWFADHPDAFLVTDKVNDPIKFAAQFVDKGRLLMELFSLEAIEEAAKNNIAALISDKPLSEIKGDRIAYLKKNNIKHIAMSRRNITKKTEMLKKYRENNIRVYVYHVNFDGGKNEQYVLANEIGLVYGMYADKWIPGFEGTKK